MGSEYSRHAKQIRKKGRLIVNISKKRLDELKKIQDSYIDYSDIPELDKDFWDNAKLVLPEKRYLSPFG